MTKYTITHSDGEVVTYDQQQYYPSGLPELIGSPEQVARAEKIRADKFVNLGWELGESVHLTCGEDDYVEALFAYIERSKLYETSAQWWIDHGNNYDVKNLVSDYIDFCAELKNDE